VSQLIGFYSSLPMSGKSTAAAALSGVGYKRLPFAGTLKRMIRVLLLDLGQSEAEADAALSDQKELPCILLNTITPRELLQTLGTQWGRELVHPDLWVRCWKGRAISALGDGFSVVADDVRRTNEARAICDLGGVMVKVVRPGGGSEAFSDHASEGGLEDWPFDHTIVNDGSIDDLQRQVLALHHTLQTQLLTSDGSAD
jgi:hypothetical protein